MSLGSIALKIKSERMNRSVSQTATVNPYKKESIGSIANRVVVDCAVQKQERMDAIRSEAVSWNDCKHCKPDADKVFCKKFFSLCAQDKCPKKLRE
ncbi:MAG: hypothetical protein ABIA76_02165 [Candidatus Diapherotrites archaeon]